MNFNTKASPWNMPELEWYYGYPLVMISMGIIAVGMLVYFVKQGWLLGHPRR
jgi:magnesium transporter